MKVEGVPGDFQKQYERETHLSETWNMKKRVGRLACTARTAVKNFS